MTQRDIENVIQQVKARFSDVGVYQIEKSNPYDDDGIWYFWIRGAERDEIQVENSFGTCPFYCSTYRSDEMQTVDTVEATLQLVSEHLSTASNDNVPLAVCLVSGG